MGILIFMTFLAYFYLRVNPQMEISGIQVYTIVSKIGLKSDENESAHMKNLILWVCREC